VIPDGFSLLFDNEQILRRTRELAVELRRRANGKQLTFVGVLDGALFFMADLIRELELDVKIDFLRVSSYGGSMTSGNLRLISGLTWNVNGSEVVLVDDILDTGRTLAFCCEHLRSLGAAGVQPVMLLAKERPRIAVCGPEPLVGFSIPDRFVIGYGMDWEGRFRHLPAIYIKDEPE
jgi:hypoxanthine phosphoribosyltransferase